ncbi:MAG: ribosome-associated translation inhibitor RaiA [Lentisphaerae bacterium]|nr:ribosome-associated translation inhibitor RaiA [Lentisphaerota bacterium]
MEIIISGRQFEVDAALRDYAEEKVQQLTREYSKLTSARLVLSEERGRCVAEGHLAGKNMTLNATARGDSLPRMAIDEVVEKLERQLLKRVERIRDHRAMPLSEAELREAAAGDTPPAADKA